MPKNLEPSGQNQGQIGLVVGQTVDHPTAGVVDRPVNRPHHTQHTEIKAL